MNSYVVAIVSFVMVMILAKTTEKFLRVIRSEKNPSGVKIVYVIFVLMSVFAMFVGTYYFAHAVALVLQLTKEAQ